MKALAAALLVFATPVQADEWTASDSLLQGATTLLLVADWMQTRTIAKSPDRFDEANWFLGRHPSVGAVDGWFLGSILGHLVVSLVLPRPWREVWQGLTITLELAVVAYNARVGIGFNFP